MKPKSFKDIASLTTDNRKPLVLFSGGIDSSYTVLCLATEGTDIDVLSIDKMCHRLKEKMEEKARDSVYKHLESIPSIGQVRNKYTHSAHYNNMFNSKASFTQIMPWLHAASVHLDPSIHSCVVLSYLADDDAAMVFKEIQKIWKNMMKAMFFRQSQVPVVMPLSTFTKQRVVSDLRRDVGDFEKNLWFCQLPETVPQESGAIMKVQACGRCTSCLKMRQTELLLDPPVELRFKEIPEQEPEPEIQSVPIQVTVPAPNLAPVPEERKELLEEVVELAQAAVPN